MEGIEGIIEAMKDLLNSFESEEDAAAFLEGLKGE